MTSTLLSTLLFSVLLGTAAKAQAQDKASIPEQNKAIVRHIIEEVMNTGRLEQLDALVSPTYKGLQGSQGPAAFAAHVAALRTGFPDIRWVIEDLVAEQDRVAVRWLWTGKHTAPYNGYAPTGKVIASPAIAIYRLKDGKVTEAALITDRLGFLQQLGIASPELGKPGQAGR